MRSLRDTEFALAISRKIFRLEMRKLSPRAGRARPEQPSHWRAAQSIRNRVATAAASQRVRGGLRETRKQSGPRRFFPLRREQRNANAACRSGCIAPVAKMD